MIAPYLWSDCLHDVGGAVVRPLSRVGITTGFDQQAVSVSLWVFETSEPLLYMGTEVSASNDVFVVVCHGHFLFV
ncbi:hypothetical protein ASR50_34415 [Streptomyces sp. 4F]|nr:hypothetical protein ASR50_01025 [Streptomyces sp. 4F]ALV54004.1 hypothetical protein ASR50_34415 [Streptomyces sp. 4F]